MTGALEKAARACGEADGFDWDEFRPDPALREELRNEYRAQARAVLLAVRDPDKALWLSGMHGTSGLRNEIAPDTVSAAWRAMIDAILSGNAK